MLFGWQTKIFHEIREFFGSSEFFIAKLRVGVNVFGEVDDLIPVGVNDIDDLLFGCRKGGK